jgi:hypothetical protein
VRIRVARKVMRVAYFRAVYKDSTLGRALELTARHAWRRPWFRGTHSDAMTAACFEAVGPGGTRGDRLTPNGWSRRARRHQDAPRVSARLRKEAAP